MADDRRIFTYGQATALLPEVRRITEHTYDQVDALRQSMSPAAASTPRLQERIDQLIEGWARELIGLGLEVKGLWLVDFDNGSGYYCWRYPESSLQYYHSYEEGFQGRVPIQ
jgi:hypothetical protein